MKGRKLSVVICYEIIKNEHRHFNYSFMNLIGSNENKKSGFVINRKIDSC